MAARASLLGQRDDAVPRTRNSSAHEKRVALGVDLHDSEPQLGVSLGSLVPRHALALDDSRRVGARTDRARLPVASVAVGGGTTAESVAVHYTLEAATLGRAGPLHQLARPR